MLSRVLRAVVHSVTSVDFREQLGFFQDLLVRGRRILRSEYRQKSRDELCWPLETWVTYTTPYYIGVRNEGALPTPQTAHEDVTVLLSVDQVSTCSPGGAVASESVNLLPLDPVFAAGLFSTVDRPEPLRLPER